jgi:hypothetical protein
LAKLDALEKLFVGWSFFFQIALIVHFALRKGFFARYTLKYGWLIYALSIPALVISIILLRGGKSWSFWLAGFIFLVYAAYGYWIDFIKQIQWRNPLQLSIMFPYVLLYLSTVMFYWWPLGQLDRSLWFAYAILFVLAMILNITSH